MARTASNGNGGESGYPANPKVPRGTRIYAIGDSHGCVENLRALHAAILKDSRQVDKADKPAKRRVAVYLGLLFDDLGGRLSIVTEALAVAARPDGFGSTHQRCPSEPRTAPLPHPPAHRFPYQRSGRACLR